MIGEIRQNFTEASASVGLILATALKHEHFSPVLQEMHQFPIEERITFTILFMTFQGLNGQPLHISPTQLGGIFLGVCLMSDIICATVVSGLFQQPLKSCVMICHQKLNLVRVFRKNFKTYLFRKAFSINQSFYVLVV